MQGLSGIKSQPKFRATESQWTFGWSNEEQPQVPKSPRQNNAKYHNVSSVTLGSEGFHPDRKDLKDERFKQTTQEINNKMPTYNSKNGGKATVLLGDFKPDYRNRDQIMLEEREKLKSPRGKKCEFSKQVSA